MDGLILVDHILDSNIFAELVLRAGYELSHLRLGVQPGHKIKTLPDSLEDVLEYTGIPRAEGVDIDFKRINRHADILTEKF